jgi:transcriptional regulator with XRE-family HTH domain
MAEDAELLHAQGQRLKDLRERKGVTKDGDRVTQRVVADVIGVTERAYHDWENGSSDIKPENLKALADYYETTRDYIKYGVSRREAPDLAAALDGDGARLDRIEFTLDVVLGALEQLVGKDVLEAVRQDIEIRRGSDFSARPTRAA